jgi:hypothetical protein
LVTGGILLPSACIPTLELRDDYMFKSILQPARSVETVERDANGNPVLPRGARPAEVRR